MLRVLIADDERPARRFLSGVLASFPDIVVVAEAASGEEAIEGIELHTPDLVLLDLNMPELGGLEVARLLKSGAAPLVAFVTAHDELAIHAFELDAIDYLLKPVARDRLAATLARARQAHTAAERARQLATAATALETVSRRRHLERIPVKRRNETVLLPVRQIVSVVAERELLHLTTLTGERFTIAYRLHALEARLDPRRFVRISRSAMVAIEAVQKFSPMPGGTYEVLMSNGQTLIASRIQSRVLRETLLRL